MFSLVWEGFQYNLVKRNELTKGGFRISKSYASRQSKLPLSLFPPCHQRRKVDIFMMRTNCFLKGIFLTLAIHSFAAEVSAMSSD